MSSFHDRLRTLLILVPFVVQHRGVKLSELATRLGIGERELLQEIDFLLMVGCPPFLPSDMIDIYVSGQRVYVDLHQSLERPLMLTDSEALALALAAQVVLGSPGMGEAAETVRAVLGKVLAALPQETRRLFDRLAGHFLLFFEQGLGPAAALLQKAIDNRVEVEIEYFAFTRQKLSRRSVRPYALIPKGGKWYLVAYCLERSAPRLFRLTRIRHVALSQQPFSGEPEFDLRRFVADCLAIPTQGRREVLISFEPEVERWAEERWGRERLQRDSRGRIQAKLADVADEFVLGYVASLDGGATIEAPTELAQVLREQVGRALQRYATERTDQIP